MKINTCQWSTDGGWDVAPASLHNAQAGAGSTLVLAFCDPSIADDPTPLAELTAALPGAIVVGCSTAGQIRGSEISDATVVATIIDFQTVRAHAELVSIDGIENSHSVGTQLSTKLLSHDSQPPTAVLVLSDGLDVNGTELLAGIAGALPEGVAVSGGLAADGPRFVKTWVTIDGAVHNHGVVGVGLWGDRLRMGHGSAGGWQSFGPQRQITKSDGSVLYELDGQPALSLYKSYLGDKAQELPGSALLFPLRIVSPDGQHDLVRTVLAVDDGAESMQFAGDIPTGWDAQLMRTTVDRLVGGACSAAMATHIAGLPPATDTLTLAVSCVGRRLVMGSRTEEEVEACLDELGERTVLCGFYSYGEISPVDGFASLHNQTMTLTTIAELPQ